ncbi:MAG: 30S ribosome-binding factor RbfA [Bacilli bacterium]|nr:30S ribosome-binding factor RbfA [Bacilli bacterium]
MKLKGERVASDLMREISKILLTEIKDEDLKNVTITYATVTNDLSFAKIYFTTLDDYKKEKVIHDINGASSFFRSELAGRLNIRHIPELKFVYDESIEYGKKIENIIEQINKEE